MASDNGSETPGTSELKNKENNIRVEHVDNEDVFENRKVVETNSFRSYLFSDEISSLSAEHLCRLNRQKYLAADAMMFRSPENLIKTSDEVDNPIEDSNFDNINETKETKTTNNEEETEPLQDEARCRASQSNTGRASPKIYSQLSFELENLNNQVESVNFEVTTRSYEDEETVELLAQENIAEDGLMSSRPKVNDPEEVQINISLVQSSKVTNTRALPRDAQTYELETFEKKALLIFNQVNCIGYRPRIGSRKDGKDLRRTFEKFGFEVEEEFDMYRTDIFKRMVEFSKRDFTDYGCIAVAILTHGSDMGALRAKDKRFYESDIVNYFKSHENHTLVTKPILIIIQACRGKKMSESMSVANLEIRKDTDEKDLNYHLPLESDMIVLNSSYSGRLSIRHELDGSWFIQTLCKKIDQLAATHDIERIMTEVKRSVAIDMELEEYNRRTGFYEIYKQMPTVQSTLIRQLYLRKYTTVIECVPEVRKRDETLQKSISLLGGPCSCRSDIFEYLRNCLRHFKEEHPGDEKAEAFLEIAEVITDKEEFDELKKTMAKRIQNHLVQAAKDCSYYKFLYFYKEY